MENKIYLDGKHPLSLLAELSVPDVSSGPLALRNSQIVQQQVDRSSDYSQREQQVFRRVPRENLESPVVNIYNFSFYFGGQSPIHPQPSALRGFAGNFPERRLRRGSCSGRRCGDATENTSVRDGWRLKSAGLG